MWDNQTPPTLASKHCYGLPATDLSLKHMLHNPVRLRRIEVSTAVTGFAAICAGGSTIGLHTHSNSSPDLKLYEAIEGVPIKEEITWLFCPIREDEVITEIGIRGYPKPDHSTLWFASLTVRTNPLLSGAISDWIVLHISQSNAVLRLVHLTGASLCVRVSPLGQ